MAKQITTFLVSLLTPGLGYIQIGDKKNFYRTISIFFSVIILAITFRLFISFKGLCLVSATLLLTYLFAAAHSTIKVKSSNLKIHNAGFQKFIVTVSFILMTGLSFANRRTVLGFDIMSMNVSVMQPAIFQGDKFLVDTWVYRNYKPKRGDIVVHSFNGQKDLYLNRIVGVENDQIEIKNGIVVLNGHALNEQYVLSSNVTRPESRDMKRIIVPKAHYFVMGDNRDASFGDSRFSGTISIENIRGKLTDIIASIDKSRIGMTVK